MPLVRIAIFVGFVIALALLAMPSRADHYSGPPDSWTGYWAVPAFPDIANRGPDKAKGVIFWSHGVAGTRVQYHVHPPEIIRRLARGGWDVIKVQRNPLFEKSWTASGPKHVEDLSQRIDQALAQGYKKVVAAGQSYGGAISIETAAVNDKLHAVLAFAPGHGSDAESGSARLYENLTGYLVDAVAKMRTQRALVSVAGGDHLHPREVRGPAVQRVLSPLRIPYVLLDERMPIKSHYVVSLNQFDAWYGACIADFIDPAKDPAPGEVTCRLPDPLPKFIYPSDLIVTVLKPEAAMAARSFLGPWAGTFEHADQEAGIVVEKVQDGKMTFVYGVGAGSGQNQSMMSARREAVLEDGKYVSRIPNRVTVTLSLDDNAETLQLHVVSINGRNTFTAELKRSPAP